MKISKGCAIMGLNAEKKVFKLEIVLFFAFRNMNNEVMNVLSEIQVEDYILGQIEKKY